MIYGMSYLGGAAYPNQVLANHPAGWAAQFFLDEFGDAIHIIDSLLATGKCPTISIHILWRSDHNYQASDVAKIIAASHRLNPIILKYPNVQFRVSPICEHRITDPNLYKQFYDTTMQNFARIIYVNSYMPPAHAVLGVCNEIHGGPPAPPGQFQFSYDGVAAEDADVQSDKIRLAYADVFHIWGPQLNLHWGIGQPARDAIPSSAYIQGLIFLATDKGHTSLPKDWIWKAFSENKGTNDPRAGKPCCITPIKANEIILKDIKGNIIDVLPYYGLFSDNIRHRYYSRNYGYTRAQKALGLSGSPLCHVLLNNKDYGIINAGFRENEYR